MALNGAKVAYTAATILLPAVVIGLVWHFGHLSQYRSASDVAHAVEALGSRPFGWSLVLLAVPARAVLFVPVNALIAGVTLSFPPLHGFLFALFGSLLGACVSYAFGVLFGTRLVELFRGPKVDRIIDRLQRNAFGTSLVLHLLPFGTFTSVNLLAGSLRVPFGGFMLGTALGLLPGVLFFAFLKEQLPGVLANPGPETVLLIVGAVASLVVLGVLLKRWAKRHEEGRARA